ncbi:Hypothetical protein PACV_87 [Pacmanvirus A23]|uniref:Hypothetical protein n=1 Tax=Pacmanvirus A23 TaxID=1932881 RepID=UPI000A0954B6|nr:Hypothetical protein B9W72_gp087 [Pacmanvirus A23]SIP85804.1 Hypothetical protein PACV_87 [Pacmanvirus A23]
MFIGHKIILDRLVPVEITDRISEYVDINNARIDLEIAVKYNKNKQRTEMLNYLNNKTYTLNDLVTEYAKITPKPKSFPVNKLVLYRALYANNGKFRRFMNSKVPEGLLENDLSIKTKTTKQQILIAESVLTWNYIKMRERALFAGFELLYIVYKKIYE